MTRVAFAIVRTGAGFGVSRDGEMLTVHASRAEAWNVARSLADSAARHGHEPHIEDRSLARIGGRNPG